MNTFRVGDMVTWVDEGFYSSMREFNLKEYGPGPFRVVRVNEVPYGICSCGFYPGDDRHLNSHQDEDPPYQTLRESVGHSQWIVVEDENGKVLEGEHPPGPVKFSGAWFVSA